MKQMRNESFVSRDKYIKDMLETFRMKDARPTRTHMATNGHLDLDTSGDTVDQKLYRFIIRSLVYLNTSGPYVMFIITLFSIEGLKKGWTTLSF